MKNRISYPFIGFFPAASPWGGCVSESTPPPVLDPVTLEVLNPAYTGGEKIIRPAPRLASLGDQTVGLFWNGKPNGDKVLNRVGELLKERVKDIRIIKFWEPPVNVVPSSWRVATPVKVFEMMAEKSNAIVASSGD